jgi:DNA-binding transcriptional ArsR family regulator
MGDGPRLRILLLLSEGEWCVGEIVETVKEHFSTVSQRLRVLRSEGLVVRRREGTHWYYSLANRHVADLIHNALAHADELKPRSAAAPGGEGGPTSEGGTTMSSSHSTHAGHTHQHGPGCGHTAVKHDGHIDYLHDGHLHHMAAHGVEEHHLAVTSANPAGCTPAHDCGGHPKGHQHGPGCGHEAVPHGDHVDYLVNGHLHHAHGNHCDDHGQVHLA